MEIILEKIFWNQHPTSKYFPKVGRIINGYISITTVDHLSTHLLLTLRQSNKL